MDGSVKYTMKDSVFTMLFGDPDNVMQLYRSLHPEDDSVTPEEITTLTLETALVSSIYNDLGFQVRNTVIVLMEAQSTFSINLALRLLLYFAETVDRYIRAQRISLYSTRAARIPRPEFYVVYSGTKKDVPPVIRLSEMFADRLEDAEAEIRRQAEIRKEHGWLDMEVRIIQRTGRRDILDQYVRFCEIADEKRREYGGGIQTVREIIRQCMEEGILVEFLSSRLVEVETAMRKMFDAEEALRFHNEEIREEGREEGRKEGRKEGREEGREEGIRGTIASLKRFTRHPEDAIQALMEQYSLQQKTAEAKVALYW